MNPEHKRLVDMASGWEGSNADVTLSKADAAALRAVGAPVEGGAKPTDPPRIKGHAFFEAAKAFAEKDAPPVPAEAKPTPNQQSISGPAVSVAGDDRNETTGNGLTTTEPVKPVAVPAADQKSQRPTNDPRKK